MFKESFTDVFITEREVCTPSIIFVNGGRAKESVSSWSPTGRAGVTVDDRIPVAGTADTATAAAAAAAATTGNAVVFPWWS